MDLLRQEIIQVESYRQCIDLGSCEAPQLGQVLVRLCVDRACCPLHGICSMVARGLGVWDIVVLP